jgi:ATP-binding cassette subfamily B protein
LSGKVTRIYVWLSVLGIAVYYGSYVFLVHETLLGRFTVGRLLFLIGIVRSFRGQLTGFFGSITQGFDQLLNVADVFEIFKEKPRLCLLGKGRPVPNQISGGIEFRNVSFTYHEGSTPALCNVSFSVKPGEVIAFVGENGGGKSTIIKLLARLYDPSKGQITLDGIDLREFEATEYRRIVSGVFQDYVKYDFSAKLNIALGNIVACDEVTRIFSSAKKAGAHEFIEALPRRYEQALGRRFSEGTDLSGGQWQRVAIARSHMRDARIVILDEPSAAIDAHAEASLFSENLKGHSERITILVSHRLSTVRFASRIILLKNGFIKEAGTHDELMANKGEYAEMFDIQAKGYQ